MVRLSFRRDGGLWRGIKKIKNCIDVASIDGKIPTSIFFKAG